MNTQYKPLQLQFEIQITNSFYIQKKPYFYNYVDYIDGALGLQTFSYHNF